MTKCKPIVLFVLLLGIGLPKGLYAQSSYIYIELIKSIPCRVWQNGTEVQQLNKNFVVLAVNEQPEQNIDIEFGAELYPKQSFVIEATPDAIFAYKLARSGEKSFYLLDLVNNGKIVEANSKVNLGIGTDLNKIRYGKDQAPHQRRKIVARRSWMKRLTNFIAYNKRPQTDEKKEKKTVAETAAPKPSYGVVQVIEPEKRKPATSMSHSATPTASKPIRAACKLVASDKEVDLFAEKLAQKNNEEVQLLMARKKQFTGCLNVGHIIRLGEQYHTQYARLQFIKIIMHNAANPMELPQCESLFKTDAYKNKLMELIEVN